MARFSDVDAFLAVAEAGSFRGAAGRLEVTKSTVSRAIGRLEEHLGTALFLRDTTSVRLTDAGSAYRRGARRAAAALTEAEQAARSVVGEVEGTLRLAAPPALGPGWLAPLVADFVAAHPGVQVEVTLSDRMVNPILDDVDLAIRTGSRLPDSDLKSRKLADLAMWALATPALAAKVAQESGPVPAVTFVRSDGSPMRYPDPPRPLQSRVSVDDYLSLRACVLRGAGVGILSSTLAAADVEAGRLVRVFERWKLPSGRIWVVYPARRSLPVKLDRMLTALAKNPP